jgi:hypothetical protein
MPPADSELRSGGRQDRWLTHYVLLVVAVLLVISLIGLVLVATAS